MNFDIPGSMIVGGAFAVATTLAVLTYQVRELRKAIYNGIHGKLDKIIADCSDHRHRQEIRCIERHQAARENA